MTPTDTCGIPLDSIILGDCREGLKALPDGSVDLLMMDPPYSLDAQRGAGAFGSKTKSYHGELLPLSDGIETSTLDLIADKMRKLHGYVWCNKNQLRQYLDYFEGERGCNIDLLTWHKTNPIPTCRNKYLSDTEYIVFFREPGVPMHGTYQTLRKWYATPTNKADKDLWGHPTIKPVEIVRNLILNSCGDATVGGDSKLILDPYMGSGTTAVASRELGHHFIGFELEPGYREVAMERVSSIAVPVRSRQEILNV